MKTHNEQTWGYLKENYPLVYKIGQDRLAEHKRKYNNFYSACIGLDQFLWDDTKEGDMFWRKIHHEGDLTEFEKLYGKSPTAPNQRLTLSLYPSIQ